MQKERRAKHGMTKFKVTYVREKPAGVVQFDPKLELSNIMEIPASTPEEAVQHLDRTASFMRVVRIEKLSPEQDNRNIVQLSETITNVSGIASNVYREVQDFLQKNPYLPTEAKAIILKSQEGFEQIETKLDELGSTVKPTWKSRMLDWVIGAIVGIIFTVIFQVFSGFLFRYLFP